MATLRCGVLLIVLWMSTVPGAHADEAPVDPVLDRAATDANSMIEMLTGGVAETGEVDATDPTAGIRGAVCEMGMESFLSPGERPSDPTGAFGASRSADKCEPSGFAKFICQPDLFRFMARRDNGGAADALRRAVFDSLSRESAASCAGSWVGLESRRRAYCTLVQVGYDVDRDECPANTTTSAGCLHARQEFMDFVNRESTNPRFMDTFLSTGSNRARILETARAELQLLRSHMKAALWGSYCHTFVSIHEVNDSTFLDSNACNIEGAGSTPAPAAFLRRMFESIDRAEVQIPSTDQCTRDADNVMVARRPDGSPLILACPRALMRPGTTGRLALRAELARALGHGVDSCALEMMTAGTGPDARSLSRLSDGLRACLIDNHLRTPALAFSSRGRGADPAGGATYAPAWLGDELGDGRDGALGFDEGGTSPRRTHCSGLRNASGAPVGSDIVSRQQNPANSLEAQYWATQALGLAFEEEGPGLMATQASDESEWDAFCGTLTASERRSCIRARGGSAHGGSGRDARKFFRLRAMFQPACRALADGGADASAPARGLFGVINHDPSIRALLGCRANTDREVGSIAVPSPAQARRGRAVHPNYGFCGSGLLEHELNELTNGRAPRETERVGRTLTVADANAKAPVVTAAPVVTVAPEVAAAPAVVAAPDGAATAADVSVAAPTAESPSVVAVPITSRTIDENHFEITREDGSTMAMDIYQPVGDGRFETTTETRGQEFHDELTSFIPTSGGEPVLLARRVIAVGGDNPGLREVCLAGISGEMRCYNPAYIPEGVRAMMFARGISTEGMPPAPRSVPTVDGTGEDGSTTIALAQGDAPAAPQLITAPVVADSIETGVSAPRRRGASDSASRRPMGAVFGFLSGSSPGRSLAADTSFVRDDLGGRPRASSTCRKSTSTSCGMLTGVSPGGRPIRRFPDASSARSAGCPGNRPCECATSVDEVHRGFRCVSSDSIFAIGAAPPEGRVVAVDSGYGTRIRLSSGRTATSEVAYPIGSIPNSSEGHRRLQVYAPGHCFERSGACVVSDLWVASPGDRPRRITIEEVNSRTLSVRNMFKEMTPVRHGGGPRSSSELSTSPITTSPRRPVSSFCSAEISPSARSITFLAGSLMGSYRVESRDGSPCTYLCRRGTTSASNWRCVLQR